MFKTDPSGNLLCDAGSSNLLLCDSLEEWEGVGGGEREIQDRGDVYVYSWFMLMHGRNQHNIVKQLFSN